MPDLYIITGSNGAGKSTIGQDYIPARVLADSPIFDGDKLYLQKHLELWKSGMRVDKQIREIANEYVIATFDRLVDTAIREKKHFVYEGHFTEDSSWDVPRLFKKEGYAIHLIFFGLSNTDQSELRVLERAKDGGHNVPRLMIENNFYGNLHQLNRHLSLLDSFMVFDTSTLIPKLLAEMSSLNVTLASEKEKLPEWFQKYLPEIVNKATIELKLLRRDKLLRPDSVKKNKPRR
jgi:predicted ABC-type ATPase